MFRAPSKNADGSIEWNEDTVRQTDCHCQRWYLQPAELAKLLGATFNTQNVRSGSGASLWPCAGHFRSTPDYRRGAATR